MNYTDFSFRFLVAAYLEARENGGHSLRSGDLLEKYEFDVAPMWVFTALEDWRSKGWIGGKGLDADERSQPIRFLGAGLQHAETLLEIDHYNPSLRSQREKSATFRQFEDELLVALYREWQNGSELIPFGRAAQKTGIEYQRGWLVRAHDSLSSKGYIAGPGNRRIEEMPIGRITAEGMQHVEDHLLDGDQPIAESEVRLDAPASDRVVGFDHNQPEYQKILDGFSELSDAVRGANNLEPAERDRLISSLGAARTLWQAAQLKIVQIKVGIILAVEDVGNALSATTKAVAAALLVDTIKSFIKHQTGIDLDHV